MKKLIKGIVVGVVSLWCKAVNYHFPDSFVWYWRIDYLTNSYEKETTKFFEHTIKPGMTVVDVGANFGYFTRLFSRLVGKFGKVYAFEADSENFQYLEQNVGNMGNVQAFPFAVSDRNGTLDFYHVIGATGTHTLLEVPNSDKRSVKAVSLDSFLQDVPVDVIKIDVEGAEEAVFAGMPSLLSRVSYVVFEYTPDTSAQFLEDLNKMYNLSAINPDGTLVPLSSIQFKKGKRLYANVVLTTNV